jgi:hypothetical protein
MDPGILFLIMVIMVLVLLLRSCFSRSRKPLLSDDLNFFLFLLVQGRGCTNRSQKITGSQQQSLHSVSFHLIQSG